LKKEGVTAPSNSVLQTVYSTVQLSNQGPDQV